MAVDPEVRRVHDRASGLVRIAPPEPATTKMTGAAAAAGGGAVAAGVEVALMAVEHGRQTS